MAQVRGGRHASMNARESRNSRAEHPRNWPLRTNVAWATCQTNICKVEEWTKSFAPENRCNNVERCRCACITGVGRLEVYPEISRGFALVRVFRLIKKKKEMIERAARVPAVEIHMLRPLSIRFRRDFLSAFHHYDLRALCATRDIKSKQCS